MDRGGAAMNRFYWAYPILCLLLICCDQAAPTKVSLQQDDASTSNDDVSAGADSAAPSDVQEPEPSDPVGPLDGVPSEYSVQHVGIKVKKSSLYESE